MALHQIQRWKKHIQVKGETRNNCNLKSLDYNKCSDVKREVSKITQNKHEKEHTYQLEYI